MALSPFKASWFRHCFVLYFFSVNRCNGHLCDHAKAASCPLRKMLIVQKLTSFFVTSGPGLIISVVVISTEGALRLPTTYDNHLSESHPSQPMPQSLFNHLNRPWIDLTRQGGSIIKISWPIELNNLKWSVDIRWFFDPVLHSSLDDLFFKTFMMIWSWLLKISPQDFLITSCQFFMFQR